jgi:hypothetical protein
MTSLKNLHLTLYCRVIRFGAYSLYRLVYIVLDSFMAGLLSKSLGGNIQIPINFFTFSQESVGVALPSGFYKI